MASSGGKMEDTSDRGTLGDDDQTRSGSGLGDHTLITGTDGVPALIGLDLKDESESSSDG